jgi:F420 biosynthesis protein FbiB-like protein
MSVTAHPAATIAKKDLLYAALYERRSIRQYQPVVPDREGLERLFEVAAMAPSAHNSQPWRFYVTANENAKIRLATSMGARLARDRNADGDDAEAIKRDVERSYARIVGAPVLILVCLTTDGMDVYRDAARTRAESQMAAQSTAMATQNLLLAAHAEGLGCCWLCAPLFCPDAVRAALPIPADWQPQAHLTLGVPVGSGRLKPRKPVEQFVTYDGGTSSTTSAAVAARQESQ